VERNYSPGAGGVDMRFLLVDVESLQLPKMGVLHSLCATISDF
jgi:hypothetical protein